MRIACCAVAVILSITCFGQSADKAGSFDAYIRRALPLWKTPGISIVVVKDNKVVFRKGFGVTELGRPSPYTPATIGVCASTTKAMTAVCIGMLVDECKLRWNDKLKEVFPEFSMYDPYVSAEITVKDLLTHNAGMPNTDDLWLFGVSREDIVRRVRHVAPGYSYRSDFIYQNIMYVVAGELIRKITGQRWEDFVTQRLFVPLGMQHTYAGYSRGLGEPSKLTPHYMDADSVVRPIPFLDYDNIGPAGGVWSCANDMDKWIRFMLDSAKLEGQRLLKAETWEEMFRPQAIVPEKEFYPTLALTHSSWMTYGLGWFQEDYRGQMVQFHTGSLDGAVAILGLLPSQRMGVYLFGNLDHSELRHALMYKAIDLWGFGDNSRDWSAECYAMYKKIRTEARNKQREKEARRVQGTRPSLPLASYTGKYANDVYGEATVELSGDSLRIQFPNDVSLRLGHWNYETFVGCYNYSWWDKEWIQFSLDPAGKPMQFEKDDVVYTLQKK